MKGFIIKESGRGSLSMTSEAEAREFYDYCLKQISEWQDKGGENE